MLKKINTIGNECQTCTLENLTETQIKNVYNYKKFKGKENFDYSKVIAIKYVQLPYHSRVPFKKEGTIIFVGQEHCSYETGSNLQMFFEDIYSNYYEDWRNGMLYKKRDLVYGGLND